MKPTDSTSSPLFGYGEYDPTVSLATHRSSPTIKKFMMDQGVLNRVEAARFNADHLYKKLINKEPPIKLNDFYLKACLRYINGTTTFPEFRTKFKQKLEQEKVYYRGFIFSKNLRIVKEFSFSANFSMPSPFPIEQWRLHKSSHIDEDVLYSGKGERLGGNLYCQLDNVASNRRMFFILYTGYGDFRTLPYLLGSFQGVSNDEQPTSGEIILIKSDRDKVFLPGQGDRNKALEALEKRETRLAEAYLLLNRNIFGSSKSFPLNTEQFAMLSPHDQRLRDLVGIYRTINYNNNGNIIESWFEVKESLEAFLYTRFDAGRRGENIRQRCEMSISSYEGNYYLHVYGYHMGHVHNYAVYNLNYRPQQNVPGEVLMGAFCSCSINSRKLSAHYMLGMKVPSDVAPDPETGLQPNRLDKKDIETNCKEDPTLDLLVRELQGILEEKGFNRPSSRD